MKTILRYGLAALAIAGLMTASPAMASKQVTIHDGVLIVEDNAGLFSRDGIKRAKDEFAQVKSEQERQVFIHTMTALPAAELERIKKIDPKDSSAVNRFWADFTQSDAKGDRAKGIYILICRSPGHIHILADKALRDRGFDNAKESRVREILFASFKDAKDKSDTEQTSIRDKGLLDAISYLRSEVPVATTAKNADAKKESSGIWGYVCIGLAVLLGIWLIFGLIRAFSGGGGGGGGGPGGGGGGGGGFMTGLLGGLFGAMAGMWLYNNLLGGHTDSSAWGGDNSLGDSGGSAGESGTGDFSGDSGSGGDYDGGSGGGGDWGGGGDTGGGGGDWGGGGGDWGGGGGDF